MFVGSAFFPFFSPSSKRLVRQQALDFPLFFPFFSRQRIAIVASSLTLNGDCTLLPLIYGMMSFFSFSGRITATIADGTFTNGAPLPPFGESCDIRDEILP